MKFLIVDDLENVRRTLKKVLSSFGYDDFIEAENGVEALKVFDSSVGFVITDGNMPEMGGVQFIRELRAREGGIRVPVVMVSSDEECIVLALQAGASGFVRKPFTLGQLKQKIEETLKT